MKARAMCVCAGLAALLCAGGVRAQNFPNDNGYAPLRCRDRNLFDAVRDQPAAVDERDLVGDEANPAGLRAVDAQFLYLRMRLDADPAPGAAPRPFAWGFALDTDDDPTDYEALVVLEGQTGQIALRRNSATTVANSPADPADQPPLTTSAFAQRGRSRNAGSSFGNNDDAFLDLAVSWTDLSLVGIGPTTPVRVWLGTSTTPDRLDDDIACHDGAGGAANLSDNPSLRVVFDPNAPGGGADGGVIPGQTRAIEGGPGCSYVSRSGDPSLWWLLSLAVWLSARRYATALRRRPA